MTEEKVDVLDHGYVRYIDHMGDDRSVVNAARVSYDKESPVLNLRDKKLIAFLVRENHPAPFRHAVVTLECYAPLMVKNQWFKHLIGGIYKNDAEFHGLDPLFAWNESSRRYVTEHEEFYLPSEWRSKPENSKQGSGEPMEASTSLYFADSLSAHTRDSVSYYLDAMQAGVAPEQARLFLPAYALYVRWRWTTSLQGVMHFLKLREDQHAQYEIREFAGAVRQVLTPHFPISMGAV